MTYFTLFLFRLSRLFLSRVISPLNLKFLQLRQGTDRKRQNARYVTGQTGSYGNILSFSLISYIRCYLWNGMRIILVLTLGKVDNWEVILAEDSCCKSREDKSHHCMILLVRIYSVIWSNNQVIKVSFQTVTNCSRNNSSNHSI